MPAKNGFQRMTIDFTKEDHRKLKMLSTIIGKSMHSLIVESVIERMNGFKEMDMVEKLTVQKIQK